MIHCCPTGHSSDELRPHTERGHLVLSIQNKSGSSDPGCCGLQHSDTGKGNVLSRVLFPWVKPNLKEEFIKLGMVVLACNSSTGLAETGESLRV